MDPFLASVMLQAIRFILAVIGLHVTGKFKKKIVYLTCCAITCTGTLTLATYSYLNRDNELTLNYSWTGFIPLLAIMSCITNMLVCVLCANIYTKTKKKNHKPAFVFIGVLSLFDMLVGMYGFLAKYVN